jgi:hypothetical protein
MQVQHWSAIADEVDNFDHFALGHFQANSHSESLRLATLQGMWDEFDRIYSTPLQGVDTTNESYNFWVDVAAILITPPEGATVTAAAILRALVQHESGGTHSYDLSDPLGSNSVQVGTNKAGVGASLHQFTDWGIGFAKVQPFNRSTFNLYAPDENLLRGAEIFNIQLSSASNHEAGDARIWLAYYAYNTGGFGGGTVASARLADAGWAARADAFFDVLGLPHPT